MVMPVGANKANALWTTCRAQMKPFVVQGEIRKPLPQFYSRVPSQQALC